MKIEIIGIELFISIREDTRQKFSSFNMLRYSSILIIMYAYISRQHQVFTLIKIFLMLIK